MVSLRQKERKTYSTVLELPSDAESIVSSDAEIIEDGHDETNPPPASRRKRPRTPDVDDDDSSSDEYRGESADQEARDAELEASVALEDEESDTSGPEEEGTPRRSSSARKTSYRVKREPKAKSSGPTHKDDLHGLLAGPSVVKNAPDLRTNRQALLVASVASKPFGHTKLAARPQLGEQAELEPCTGTDPVYGMNEAGKVAWLFNYSDKIRTEEPWHFWTGKRWAPKPQLSEPTFAAGPRNGGEGGQHRPLSAEEAAKYSPAPKTIKCFFGEEEETPCVPLQPLESRPLESVINAGWVFNAGGPISGMAWKPEPEESPAAHGPQYLAVSPQVRSIEQHLPFNRTSPDEPFGSVQIWKLDKDAGFLCETILCLDVEPFLEVQWVPPEVWPTEQQSGGLLSGVSADGSIYFFSVPSVTQARAGKGKISYVHVEPDFSLTAEEAGARCMAWSPGGRLAAGLLNGGLAIWTIQAAHFKKKRAPEWQDQYLQAHMSSVKSIAWVKLPPCDATGKVLLDALPTLLLSTSFDGSSHVSDTQDPAYQALVQGVLRFPPTVAWAPHSDFMLVADNDYWLGLTRMRRAGQGQSTKVHDHGGHIMTIATSDYHDMVASGGADGTVRMSSLLKAATRPNKARTLVETLYQLDYNARTGEYRMVDNILPDTPRPDAKNLIRPATNKKPKKGDEEEARIASGAWSAYISVLRVEWQSGTGVGNAGLLASGSASGLGRIDVFSERKSLLANA